MPTSTPSDVPTKQPTKTPTVAITREDLDDTLYELDMILNSTYAFDGDVLDGQDLGVSRLDEELRLWVGEVQMGGLGPGGIYGLYNSFNTISAADTILLLNGEFANIEGYAIFGSLTTSSAIMHNQDQFESNGIVFDRCQSDDPQAGCEAQGGRGAVAKTNRVCYSTFANTCRCRNAYEMEENTCVEKED